MIREEVLGDLGWRQVLALLGERCRTDRGAALALGLEPLSRPEEARERMSEIGEARRLLALDAPLPFGGIQEVSDSLDRAAKGGALSPDELVAVAETGRGAARLRAHLDAQAEETPRLCARAGAIEDLGHVFHPILESFDRDRRLVDHASDRLGPLRREVARLKSKLEQRAQRLVDDMSRFLQDRFYTQREDRYVLPVKVESRSAVKGIVHGSSQSGQTVFVEPEEMVDLNNQFKLAEYEVAEEERRILERLSSYVAEDAPALARALEAAAELDLLSAAARMAEDLEGAEPVIDEEGRLELQGARHPLMVLSGRPCVPNDLTLEPGTILVVSGPNAGGKTVTLKTVGLAALMARAGLHLAAAPGSRIPWFERIDCAIGDSQSLERDLSTFSAHLLDLRRFLAEAGARTLVLMDEICGSTEPEQGAALARAVLEALADRRAAAIVTTHYEPLKALPAADPRFASASVGFDLDTLEPTFRVHLGVPGSSGALAVAARLGLEPEIVARARALLGEERVSVEDLLARVEAERTRLLAERAEAAAERDLAGRERAAAERERERLREKGRRAHDQAHADAVAALRDARLELDRVRKQVSRRRSDAKLSEAEKQVDALARGVAERAPPGPPPPGRPASAAELAPGTAVFVAALGGRGEVLAPPEKGRVAVQVGSLRTAVPVEDVRVLAPGAARDKARDRPAARAPAPVRQVAADDDHAPMRTADATLDLRGERVDDALAELDRFIDQSLLRELEIVFFVHGHGTGALRAAIREALARHPGIRRFRPGEPAEGGDGITIAWLG